MSALSKCEDSLSLFGKGSFDRMAQASALNYRRDRDLPNMLPRKDAFEDVPEAARTGCIVKRLSALEQAQTELRDEGSFAYSANYHIAVAGALKAERLAYQRQSMRSAAE